jgi:phage shock protein A
MTPQELGKIEKTIQEAENAVTRAEAVMEQIEERWKKEYNIGSIVEARKEVETLSKKVAKMSDKYKNLLSDLQASLEEAEEGEEDDD